MENSAERFSLDHQCKRGFLSSGYTRRISLTGTIETVEIPGFVDGLLRQVIPAHYWNKDSIKNVKGRDKGHLLLPSIPAECRPTGEELLFIAGDMFFNENEKELQPEKAKLTREPFSICWSSSFAEFEGSHGIVHHLKKNRETLPEHIPFSLLGLAFPLEIHYFRLGIELFEKTLGSRLFGFAPAVTESLLIDLAAGELAIEVVGEGLKTKHEIPLKRDNIFPALTDVMRKELGSGL